MALFLQDVSVILLIEIGQPHLLKSVLHSQRHGEILQFISALRLGQPMQRRAAQRIPEPDNGVVRRPSETDRKTQRGVAGKDTGEFFFPRPIGKAFNRTRHPAGHRCIDFLSVEIEYGEPKYKRLPGGRQIGPLAGTWMDTERGRTNFLRLRNPGNNHTTYKYQSP